MNRRDLIGRTGAGLLAGFTAWPDRGRAADGPALVGYRRTNWSRDPFARGTYSHTARGSSRRDHRRLSAPVADKLYFAGEAANPDRNSSVHAALESGRAVAQAVFTQDHARIGIVGAGIAGLAAAQILGAAGREVQVIEARDRIGGRIHTDTSLGFAADLGASWLHGSDGNPLTEVTDRAGMRKAVFEASWIAREGGREIPEWALPDWITDIAGYNNTAGTTRRSLNAWAYLFVRDYGGDEILFPDGYAQIFDAFQGAHAVSLSDPVRAIDYAGAQVRIASQRAERSFDAVIVTVPLGVLKAATIAFQPALPETTQAAIDRLGFGTLDKLFLQFDAVFWDRAPHNILTPFNGFEPGYFNSWVNLYAAFGKPVLLGLNGGPAALALASDADSTVVNGALAAILGAHGYEA